MKVRVIRVLEYEYESWEAYEKDRAQWTNMSKPMWHNRMRTVGVLPNLEKEVTACGHCSGCHENGVCLA